jgi:hypothetical protein
MQMQTTGGIHTYISAFFLDDIQSTVTVVLHQKYESNSPMDLRYWQFANMPCIYDKSV